MSLNGKELTHFGVKGMKWGVRKKREPISSKQLTTRSGKKLSLEKDRPALIARGIAAVSKSQAAKMKKSANYTIRDSRGKSIGELSTYDDSKDSRNIAWIGIRSSERGHGYATAVMKSVIDDARKAGKKYLTLEVPGDSPDARHIYESYGFKPVGSLSGDDVWGGLTAMRMDLR